MTCTYLVTGGAGFIGSHLCESLLTDGHRVLCLDNLSSGRLANVESYRDQERFVFVEDDVRDRLSTTLENQVELSDIDGIYHLASRASPTDFEEHPIDIATTNADGTRNVLSLAQKVDARVIYASSSEVYGDPKVHPQPEGYNGNVDPRGPRACYDESKRYGEALLEAFRSRYGIDTRTGRLFNTYGPRMHPHDGRVIPTFVRQILDGSDLTIHGDGTQTRTFLYVSDQIRCLNKLMDADELAGSVFNVGGTREISINMLAETILEITETDSGIVHTARPPDDPERRRPDISKTHEVLDWSPTTPLEEGLEHLQFWRNTIWRQHRIPPAGSNTTTDRLPPLSRRPRIHFRG